MTPRDRKFCNRPWHLRCMAMLMLLLEVWITLPCFADLMATRPTQRIKFPNEPDAPVAQVWAPPSRVNVAQPTVVRDRTRAKSVAEVLTGKLITSAKIQSTRLLANPLVPIGRTSFAENAALAEALIGFSKRKEKDDTSALERFLRLHPKSAWRASLLDSMGDFHRQSGSFSEALDAWQEAWECTRTLREGSGVVIADHAICQRARLCASLGRVAEVEAVLREVADRKMGAAFQPVWVQIREALVAMQTDPESTFLCGPSALARIWTVRGNKGLPRFMQNTRGKTGGFSLHEVWKLAQDSGLALRMVKRTIGGQVPWPSVAHLKSGHFVAIVGEERDSYKIDDPALGEVYFLTQSVLDKEASGYMLVASPLNDSLAAVGAAEAEHIKGAGDTPNLERGRVRVADTKVGGDCNGKGMAGYSFHPLSCNLNITDTPIGYAPPRGPAVNLTVTYNYFDDSFVSYNNWVIPYSNLGTFWNFNWLSYVDDPSATAAKQVYVPGGGTETYTFTTGSAVESDKQGLSQTKLVRTFNAGHVTKFERVFPDGSKQVYAQANNDNLDPTRFFLTEVWDIQGNKVTLEYDSNSQHRLLRIRDAINQVTTFHYASDTYSSGNNPDFYKITSVTDPWNRTATFSYSSPVANVNGGWLVSVTDPINITSSFTYNHVGFITNLTTPYGATTFARGDETVANSSIHRWLEATDPKGEKERVEFVHNRYTPVTTGSYPPDATPSVLLDESNPGAGSYLFNNQYLQWRNSFYWSKRAMRQLGGVVDPTSANQDAYNTKARIYHWLHVTGAATATAAGTLESTREPLEGRVYYRYPGQLNAQLIDPANTGSSDQPIVIARLLDDGTTQYEKREYNNLGNIKKSIDPVGRITWYNYDANDIDLLEIRQGPGTPSTAQLLATFTYAPLNAGDPALPRMPKTLTDASGQVSTFTYNSYGQVTAIKNAKNETTTFNYNANGYLQNVKSPINSTLVSFTYDSAGRVYSVKDASNYAVTNSYDALDRLTKVTYPDGTFEQNIYKLLNVERSRDRRGHWTQTFFNALGQVVGVRDPQGRTTSLDWCACGSLDSITDPAGSVTRWVRDLQGRVTSKIYSDTRHEDYAYEHTTGRLNAFTDALSQTTTYSYFKDNNLKQVVKQGATVRNPSVQFTYDPVYNRVATIQPLGVAGTAPFSYTYNYKPVPTSIPGTSTTGNGLLQSIDGSLFNGAFNIIYTYDELGRQLSRNIDGTESSVTYDNLGRVTIANNALGQFTYGYVGNTPRVQSVLYPNNQTTTFSYFNTVGDLRVQTIHHKKADGTTTISKFDYTYDAAGQIQTWTQQADAATPQVYNYTYDQADQLISAVLKTTGNPAIQKYFAYRYDNAGNRTSEQTGVRGATPTANPTRINTGTPNNLNQLTGLAAGGKLLFQGSVDEPATVKFDNNSATVNGDNTFSGYGNAVTASTTPANQTTAVEVKDYKGQTSTKNSYSTSVVGDVSRTLTYDDDGNLTADGIRSYVWENDKLITIYRGTPANGNKTEFYYDGMGRRIRTEEWVSNVKQTDYSYVWCGTEMCEERLTGLGGGGILVNRRFFAQGQQNYGGVNLFYMRDHLGSVREMTDSAGTIRARYDYDPYGKRSANLISGSTVEADCGFAGMYFHAATTISLTLFRAYAPDLSRWISREPLQEAGGLNLYAYVENNPVNAIDSDGQFLHLIAGAVIGGLVGGGVSVISDIVHGRSVNWKQAGIAAAKGAVAGFVVAAVGPAAGAFFGGGIGGAFLGGGVAAAVGNAAGQAVVIGTGLDCHGFSLSEVAVSGVLGGLANAGTAALLNGGANSAIYTRGKDGFNAAKDSGAKLLSDTALGSLLNKVERLVPDSTWSWASRRYAANATGTVQSFRRAVVPGVIYTQEKAIIERIGKAIIVEK